ncbi:hypothetical protein NQZ68_038989 [Dissostichus eleginoides]|nr:hypothetical protein NQZ68_038989 [Dissostichus eleginoides]
MLRRVFGEEKASGVRDTVSVNGAAFHVQMLIHEARLNVETGSSDSDYFNAIQVAINVYLLDLDHLLDKYKTYKTGDQCVLPDVGIDESLLKYSGTDSNAVLQAYSNEMVNQRSDDQCFLPDVGIDESLLKYSGTDSNTALQAYSNEMVNLVPGFISSLGSALGAFTAVPNALGLGALLISMIMELALKGTGEQSESSYSMLRRVFGEEKASSVRDTLSECLRRHRMFIQNEDRLKGELRRLEQQLSNHLTILKNSLLLDQQMSTRGFKIWVNGAAFHVQMLIHEARLNIETGSSDSDYFNAIQVAINLRSLTTGPEQNMSAAGKWVTTEKLLDEQEGGGGVNRLSESEEEYEL